MNLRTGLTFLDRNHEPCRAYFTDLHPVDDVAGSAVVSLGEIEILAATQLGKSKVRPGALEIGCLQRRGVVIKVSVTDQ
jgi:hypothetical protein